MSLSHSPAPGRPRLWRETPPTPSDKAAKQWTSTERAARAADTTVPVAASGEAVSHEEGTAAHRAIAVFLAGGSPAALRRGLLIVLAGVISLSLAYWAFFAVRSFLLLLILAWFAAIAMEPAVSWLAARGMRRGAATGIVFLSLFLILVGFSVAFGSLLVSQLSSLVTNLAGLCRRHHSVDQQDLRY